MISGIADHTMGGMKNIVSRGDKVLIKINTVISISFPTRDSPSMRACWRR
jgi:uncharacterized protein (DUF362 family)